MKRLEAYRKCPICGQDNKCTRNEECWCMETEVPEELLSRIPEENRGSCVCKSCVEKFNEEIKPFKEFQGSPKTVNIADISYLNIKED